MAQGLTTELGQNVLVENKGGASGIIASEMIVKSPPDGYTLLFAPSSHATLGALYPNLSFDPLKDFTPIATVARTPYLLVVHPDLGVKTVADLIALAKSKPNGIAYASTGMGTAQHLAGEILQRTAGVQILHVPYRGSGPAQLDLAAGRIQFLFDGAPGALARIKAGQAKGIAVSTLKRSPTLPDMPTLAESGLPELSGMDAGGWVGLFGPAQTPAPIVQRLNGALQAVIPAAQAK
eukprot:gene47308-biopygen8258